MLCAAVGRNRVHFPEPFSRFVGGVALDLSHKLGEKLAKYEGREIVFGFRPESIALGEQSGAYVLPASVELTEMLGDNTNVYANFEGYTAILKMDPHLAPGTGDTFEFAIPYDSVYLFDKANEKRIKLK